MQQHWIIGVGMVVVGVVGWNTWMLSRIDSRLTRLERRAIMQADPLGALGSDTARSSRKRGAEKRQKRAARKLLAGRSDASSESGGAASVADPATLLDLDDPRIREAIAEIVDESEAQRQALVQTDRVDRYLESVTAEVEAFADEFDIDSATMGKAIEEIELRTDAFVAVKQQAEAGELSWLEARRELREIKEGGSETLRELLGDEHYEILESRIWGEGKRP